MFTLCLYDKPEIARRAQRALDRPGDALVGLNDLAIVTWPSSRLRPLAWQVAGVNSQRCLSGAFWGVFFGLALLMPLCEPTPTPDGDGDGADWFLVRFGVGSAFCAEFRRSVVPGTSALVAFAAADGQLAVAERLLDFRGRLLTATLSGEEERRLRRGFADQD